MVRSVGIIVLLVVIYLGGVIGYGTFTDFEPPKDEAVKIEGQASVDTLADTLSFVIWNIGYCGLGKDMDFFYDGGEQVRPSEETFKSYLDGVIQTTKECSTADFLLLQEVDMDSRRSHYTDEVAALSAQLPAYNSSFAVNYNVEFVPLPFTEPLGQTYGGLCTFGKMQPTSSKRVSFPGNFEWPKGIFMLDRCFMVNRYPTSNGKELIVINTHNSAYDDGTLKAQQMETLKQYILQEYESGNYVLVGGDWNQCPPNFDPNSFGYGLDDPYEQQNIPVDYLPLDWNWVYDPEVPTNRKLAKPFEATHTFRTLIDFYLISPNIQALSVKGMELGFAHSDHQPVHLKIALLK